MKFEITPVGIIHSCYKEKFATPRQSGIVKSAKGQIRLLPPFNDPDTVLGLEDCSHIWLEFIFHKCIDQGWKNKVRPPRLGGNKKMGVFATRATHRPNGLGLSVVQLDKIECKEKEVTLFISGLDLIEGTPVIDIKPYIPYSDRINQASYPFAQDKPETLEVQFSDQALTHLNNSDQKLLIKEILAQDPRPAFHDLDPQRLYGANILDRNIQWKYEIADNQLTIQVISAERI